MHGTTSNGQRRSTKNQYIYKDRALKIIHTSRKLMSPEARKDKVAKIVLCVAHINNFLGNFHKSERVRETKSSTTAKNEIA